MGRRKLAAAQGVARYSPTDGSGFTTLYAFAEAVCCPGHNSDGANPNGGLVLSSNTIYVNLLQRDGERVTLPNIPRKLISSSLLTGGTLEVKQTSEQISISVSAAARQPIDTIVKLELDGSAMDLAPVAIEAQVKATASGVFQKDDSYNAGMAFDGDRATRWATDGGTRKAWLESNLGKPTTFSRVMIDEWAPGGKRVQSFELQYQSGGAWKTFHSGTTLGPGWEKKFDPITAQRVRLQILEANEGPTINEFELYQN